MFSKQASRKRLFPIPAYYEPGCDILLPGSPFLFFAGPRLKDPGEEEEGRGASYLLGARAGLGGGGAGREVLWHWAPR